MEEEWVVKRCQLRQLWLNHPEWSCKKMGEELGCSKAWVKKWLRRIRSVPLDDQQVMYGLARTPKHPPLPFCPEVINKILEIRDHPPHLLGRTPGPCGRSSPNTSVSLTLRKVSLSRISVQHLVSNGGWISMTSVQFQRTRLGKSSMVWINIWK